MASLESNCETLAVLLLQASAILTGLVPQVVQQSEDTDASKDRIVCEAKPRLPYRMGRNASIVKNWSVPVEVKLYAITLSAAQLAIVIAEIQSAMIATSGSDAAAAICVANKIGFCDPTEEGDFATEDNARKRSKTWNFICEV